MPNPACWSAQHFQPLYARTGAHRQQLADAGVNITVNPRSDALFGFDDDSFARQQAVDRGMTPALGIDLDTAFGSDLFGEMQALFNQQRSAMRYRRFRGESDVPAPISVEAVRKRLTARVRPGWSSKRAR